MHDSHRTPFGHGVLYYKFNLKPTTYVIKDFYLEYKTRQKFN